MIDSHLYSIGLRIVSDVRVLKPNRACQDVDEHCVFSIEGFIRAVELIQMGEKCSSMKLREPAESLHAG